MDDKKKLTEEEMNHVTGGAEIREGQPMWAKKIISRIDMLCPNCGNIVHQEFYSDGSAKYDLCPNNLQNGTPCNNPLGVG